jgi:hypothetical protein
MHERWGNEMEEDLWRLSHSLIHTHTHVPVLTRISALFIYINLYTSITIFFSKVILFRGCVCGFFSSSSFLFYTTHSCCCCSFVGSRRGETLDGIVVTKSRPNRRYLDGEKSKSVRDACLSL